MAFVHRYINVEQAMAAGRVEEEHQVRRWPLQAAKRVVTVPTHTVGVSDRAPWLCV